MWKCVENENLGGRKRHSTYTQNIIERCDVEFFGFSPEEKAKE